MLSHRFWGLLHSIHVMIHFRSDRYILHWIQIHVTLLTFVLHGKLGISARKDSPSFSSALLAKSDTRFSPAEYTRCNLLIFWQRFCELARLRIAYCHGLNCAWVVPEMCLSCAWVAYCLSVCLCSACLTCNIACGLLPIDIGYSYNPLPDKLSAEDRSLSKALLNVFILLALILLLNRHADM